LKDAVAVLTPDSGYKPNGGLTRSILQRVGGSTGQVLMKETTKFQRKNESACASDYLYYCRDTGCACADNNCPAEVSKISSITLQTSISQAFSNNALRYLQATNGTTGSQSAPQGGQQGSGSQGGPQSNDKGGPVQNSIPTSYLICSVCLSGRRFLYSMASFTSGNLFDFADSQGNNIGKDTAQQQNQCNTALASGTTEQKANCRGNMNDDCAKKMDNSCGSTGLYDMLVKNPLPPSPLPPVCDDTVTDYTESACFQWLAPLITKATLVFDYRRLQDLPKEMAKLFSTRRLQSSSTGITIVSQDQVALKDPTAVLPTSVTQVTSTEIGVDGATTVSAPSSTAYLNDVMQTAAAVTLGQSYLSVQFSLLVIALFAFMF